MRVGLCAVRFLSSAAEHTGGNGDSADAAGFDAAGRFAVCGAVVAPASPAFWSDFKRLDRCRYVDEHVGVAVDALDHSAKPRRRYCIAVHVVAGADGLEHRDHGSYFAPRPRHVSLGRRAVRPRLHVALLDNGRLDRLDKNAIYHLLKPIPKSFTMTGIWDLAWSVFKRRYVIVTNVAIPNLT